GRTGLTQRDFAARLATNRRSVQDWEGGAAYPTAERLKTLIVVLLESSGFTAGREEVEAHELWAAALRRAPRMDTPLDEVWLDRLLTDRAAALTTVPRHVSAPAPATEAAPVVTFERVQDWGDAPDGIGFVGRAEDLAALRHWVLEDHCRLLAVLGMGGIGKTALVSQLAQTVLPSFQCLYWRSLRDALPAGEWLAGAIGFLSAHTVVPPEGESARLAMLVQLLRNRPSLLLLDNFETVLEPGAREGRYRDGFGAYGALLHAVGETRHQSCLVVTSREAPPELAVLGGNAVRHVQLGGLGAAEGEVLLADKQLVGTDADWADLIARLGGNGLALKVVGETIRQIFGGDIAAFLQQAGASSIFGGVRRLLAEQIGRSSPLEQKLLRLLAVEREPVSLAQLIAAADVEPGDQRGAVLEAIEALRRRSLVEHAGTATTVAFTLQSVVLEYVTDRLVQDMVEEIATGLPSHVAEQPLIEAQAKDYVRHSQERLIGASILRQLRAQFGDGGAEERLVALLDGWRDRPAAEQRFGPGNVVNLQRLLRGDLRALDMSRLAIRQAYLAGVEAQDASLAGANLADAVLAEAFDFPGSVALSSDGALLAAGTSTGEVWLWRVADRTLVAMLEGHLGAVWAVALSPDGRLLVSGGVDGTVRLWDPRMGHLLRTLRGHSGTVWGVALTPDGQLLASAGGDGTARLWAASTGQALATLEGHTSGVRRVALSLDGQVAATAGQDGTVRLWDVPTGRSMATLVGHIGGLWGVALSADRQLLASGGQDGTVRLWEAGTGQPLATLEGHTGGVWSVALSADGGLAASGGGDGTLRLWEAPFARHDDAADRWSRQRTDAAPPTGARPTATLQGHTGSVWGAALTADGRLMASGGGDGTVRLWETSTGRPLATLQGHTSGIRAVALTADGQLVASGGQDGLVRLWQASTGRLLSTLQGHTGGLWGVALSADGQLVASGSGDGTVRLWEVSTGRQVAVLRNESGGVWSLALSRDGRLVASGSEDGAVRLWEARSGRLLATLQGHTSAVAGVALSADGALVASGGADGNIRLWQAPFAAGHASQRWGGQDA
ncbi:MAG TPA: hypothetical protein VGE94_07455, partial [Chloroflexota bacterium]